MQQKPYIEGSIYGYLIGNAIGTKCKNIKRQYTTVSQQVARKYSYAGAMSLCTMSSLLTCDCIDIEDLANTFYEWYVGSYLSSELIKGRTSISQAIRLFANGMPPDKCGSKIKIPDNSALMRMLPIALWNINKSNETIIKDAHLITLFTNQQIEAQIYSALYCLIIKFLLKQNKTKVTDILNSFYKEHNMNVYTDKLNNIIKFLSSNPKPLGTEKLGDSFWTTIQINKANNNFEQSIIQSVLLSYDCPIIASLTGSLTGLSLGINEIPQQWLNNLELSSEVTIIIEKFISKCL